MIKELLKKIGFNIDDYQEVQFRKYYEFLVSYNEKVNLTAITELKDVYIKHFYDSALVSQVIDLNKVDNLCDVGSGAGFPSIVLKILFPNLKITIVDSLDKRITFLKQLVELLNLSDVTLLHARAEEYGQKEGREKFDVVTARAVARENILNELCLPLTKVNGFFISMKGKDYQEEIAEGNSLKILNSKIEDVKEFILPEENSLRAIIKIKHLKKIDNKYPRSFSKIKNKPL